MVHKGHSVVLYLTDALLSIDIAIEDNGIHGSTPQILEGGVETFWCRDCQVIIDIDNWEFV
jgi:hypothetical protein